MGRNDIAVLTLHRGIVTRDRGITLPRRITSVSTSLIGRNDIAVLALHRGIVTRDRDTIYYREGIYICYISSRSNGIARAAMYRNDQMVSRCIAMGQNSTAMYRDTATADIDR